MAAECCCDSAPTALQMQWSDGASRMGALPLEAWMVGGAALGLISGSNDCAPRDVTTSRVGERDSKERVSGARE